MSALQRAVQSEALDQQELAQALRDTARHMRAAWPDVMEEAAPSVAVILPCHNEGGTIGAVIAAFAAALPAARIIVFDNASSDDTAMRASEAGAEVYFEKRKGKGNVVRRMFADIEADIYLMADGDGTYDAASAPRLIRMIAEDGCDMAVGARQNVHSDAHRNGHAIGNKLFNKLYGTLFGAEFGDIFSGYRAFSRRFVKSFPALSSGFEIETELSVHAGALKLPTGEIDLPYGKRPEGSTSKLRTFRDGWRILRTFGFLLKETRPALFFGLPAALLCGLSLLLATPLLFTWLETGLVPRLPTALFCVGLMLASGLLATSGLILDSLARSRVEQKRILYLAISATRLR